MRVHKLLAVATAVAVSSFVYAAPVSNAKGGCAGKAKGGEWPSYGQNLSNTRTQSEEKVIDAAAAPHLEPLWAMSTGDQGGFQSTPSVADGCVYAATNSGLVYAFNADTGEEVWSIKMGAGAIAGGVFSVTVTDDKVFGISSGPKGPFAFALDQKTGKFVWKTKPIESQSGYYSNASAVVWKDLMFVGISGAEGDAGQRGYYALVDTDTGAILQKQPVIPDDDHKQGYGGGGLWSTAVIDTKTGYAYVGSGNPYGKTRDHRYTNAILKIDLVKSRSTFGEIVDAYKGTPDQYYPGAQLLADTPVCKAEQIPPTIDNPECGQIDLDFGASPNLFRNDTGELLVGVVQKSGVFHTAYTDTMQEAWTTVIGGPCALCNAASSAYDGKRVYVIGTPVGVVTALDPSDGSYEWTSPVADGVHYQAVTVANGVVYTIDSSGALDMFDAETGIPLFSRPVSADTPQDACGSLGSGVAVARGKVYVTCDVGAQQGGWTLAYSYDPD